jgi:hypothetical protein
MKATLAVLAAVVFAVPAVASGGIVDVHFHVITDSSGEGNLTDRQIDRQIDVLNDAFAGTG